MNVNKWGPSGWTFLHTITFNYPLEPTDEDKSNYSNYFKLVGAMLPCKYCRQSYLIYYKYFPIDPFLDSREGVCYWLYRLHELINQKIFKDNISFEEVIRKYEDIRAKCGKMTRDGDLDKKYKTCQAKPKQIDKDYLEKFLEKAKSYDPLMEEMINTLYKSEENPNKEYLEYIKKHPQNSSYKIHYKYFPMD